MDMPLEGLLELIQRIGKRIDDHGDALRQNEWLTRYALIDPLLRELGWDTGDPAQVFPEYQSQSGKPDYTLFGRDKKPAMIVEAKKLGTRLEDAVTQVINYCVQGGIDYFAVTDGGIWEIYETHRRGDLGQKMVARFDLKAQSPAEVCLQALALWRPSVEAGHAAAGQTPVLGLVRHEPDPLKPTPPDPDEYEWQSVSALDSQPGSAPPVEVRFPDNSVAQITAWRSILVETVRWLVNGNYLSADRCPIQKPKSKRYLVAANPIHPSGKRFYSGIQVGPLYAEGHAGLSQIVRNTRFIIEHVGQDPARFKVRFP